MLVVGLCLVSAIALESNQNTTAFLERLKEALHKFTNLDLDSYEGQVILKDKFLSQCESEIRIKLQQLQQQDPTASLDEMVQTASHTFYNREQEKQENSRRASTSASLTTLKPLTVWITANCGKFLKRWE